MGWKQEFIEQYIGAALYTSFDKPVVLAPKTRAILRHDCLTFLDLANGLIGEDYLQAAYNFWLVRNSLDPGFTYFDKNRDDLTAIARRFPRQVLYIEDGLVQVRNYYE